MIRFVLFAAVFVLASLSSPGARAEVDSRRALEQVKTYLAQLDTAKARFIQTAPDGTQQVGTFYLNRPGRLRFEYDDPVGDFVVADGAFLYFYDADLKQTSNAPIGQTLADFLLRKDISLAGDVKVMGVQETGGLLQVLLTQAADPAAGSLTLGFRSEPFALKKWRVVDAQGQITEVELFDVRTGLALPATLFVYRDPAHPKGKFNE